MKSVPNFRVSILGCSPAGSFSDLVMRYVELNPVRGGLASAPEDYSWSSAIGHLGGADATGLLNLGLVPRVYDGAVGRRFGRRLRGVGSHSRKYPPWQILGHKRSYRRTETPTPGRVTAW
jgi:hypothetical protein